MRNTNKKSRSYILISLFATWWSCFSWAQEAVRLPGTVSRIESPNGKYALISKNYSLYIEDVAGKNVKEIYTYSRSISILWSPQGNKLIVNDHGGSDYSKPIIFIFNGSERVVDVEEELKRQLWSNDTIFGNHHVYIEGAEWLDEDRIMIKIWGHGDVDPKGFLVWYEYRIDDGFKIVKRGVLEK